MENYYERLNKLSTELKANPNIVVTEAEIKPGVGIETLEEYEQELEVKFNASLKKFFQQVGGVSISWKTNEAFNAPADDAGYLAGAVQILDPFTMIMGKTGTRWKDVLWFEDIPDEDVKSFIPFDFPSTELMIGFKLADGKLSDELYLYDSSNGVSPLPLSFDQYMDYTIDSRGIFYWQKYYTDKSSPEYQRFIKYLPQIFTERVPEFFI